MIAYEIRIRSPLEKNSKNPQKVVWTKNEERTLAALLISAIEAMQRFSAELNTRGHIFLACTNTYNPLVQNNRAALSYYTN